MWLLDPTWVSENSTRSVKAVDLDRFTYTTLDRFTTCVPRSVEASGTSLDTNWMGIGSWLVYESNTLMSHRVALHHSCYTNHGIIKDEDPKLYQLVTDHMMHGPCCADNLSCPCTIEYKCTKKFPRQFNETTVIDDSGYALYKRRNDACEAAWCIYGFEIHYWTPSVERFLFHLNDEQHVIFDATESIDYDVDKSSVNETKFKSWMELNQTDTFARRIHHVPPSWGELYYLSAILNKVRGPMEWDDLKKVDDVLYPTYRDACYARGLLQDDKEYIDGFLEASLWGMGDYLRSIFIMLIMTDSMSWPEIVWEKTWMKLAEDV
nr:hypothetical protein [Tanacetum cinerariifolium]